MKILQSILTAIACCILFIIVLLPLPLHAGDNFEITGDALRVWLDAQEIEFQNELRKIFNDAGGYFISGPLDPTYNDDNEYKHLYHAVRITCPNALGYPSAINRVLEYPDFDIINSNVNQPRILELYDSDFCRMIRLEWRGKKHNVLITTHQQTRFMLWLKYAVNNGLLESAPQPREIFLLSMLQHFSSLDQSRVRVYPPLAKNFGLDSRLNLYQNQPDKTLQENACLDLINKNRELDPEFGDGIEGFIPTEKTMESLKKHMHQVAFTNKEENLFQNEYQKFFWLNGDTKSVSRLTKSIFDSLSCGEYLFAVGLNYEIRFFYRMTTSEIEILERQTREEVPLLSHIYLFPGEPVFTAGSIFISDRTENKLIKVNAMSHNYFYSNSVESVEDDISRKSNDYFKSLGHLFIALDKLGIDYRGVLISKF